MKVSFKLASGLPSLRQPRRNRVIIEPTTFHFCWKKAAWLSLLGVAQSERIQNQHPQKLGQNPLPTSHV